MNILALDTSTEYCSVAVSVDGKILDRSESGNRHAERILSMVDALLAEAGLSLKQLDAIAFGRGPGSFTGLRIGAGVAQGLAFGAELPVVPISSLVALAQGVDAPRVLAALDARMNQVYWGAYRRNPQGLVELVGEECVASPADVPMPPGEGWIGAGPGWAAYGEALKQRIGARLSTVFPEALPSARSIAQLATAAVSFGQIVRPEQAIPVYLRDNVAAKMTKA
ncbi:MAG: tRNA (adenosine(37)-N6)-threonylcarbamoyltransferase complex dimerization subunit type 1 TsaB [Pseudomonadota bacterium]